MSINDEIKENLQKFNDPMKQTLRNIKDDVGDAISDMVNDRPHEKGNGCCLWSAFKTIFYVVAAMAVVYYLVNGGKDIKREPSDVPESTIDQNVSVSDLDDENEQLRKDWRIFDAQAYHDGVVWVQYDIGDTKQWCCCDKTGEILFWLDPLFTPTTHFANGIAIVDKSMIVNKKGEVIWSIWQEGLSAGEKIWGQGSIESIDIVNWSGEEFYGYTMVRFDVECYDYSGEMTGVLNEDGSWRLEPISELNPAQYISGGWYYLHSSEGEIYYDLITNTFVAPWDENVGANFMFRFADHNDLVFQSKYDEFGRWTGDGFYDATGNKVIDLSRYIIDKKSGDPEFNDGYAMLEIRNEQGSSYYTIIDTTGKEMFAPRKRVSHRGLSCGLYWVIGDTVVDGQYYNVYGEPAFDLDCKNGSPFSEGMAFASVKIDGEYSFHFINTEGEIVF